MVFVSLAPYSWREILQKDMLIQQSCIMSNFQDDSEARAQFSLGLDDSVLV